VKGREEHLHNTLYGLSLSSVIPDEVVIINMGDPIYIRSGLAEKLNINIHNLENESDGLPLAEARNEGAKKAKGKQLHFLDVDCIPAPDYLKKAISYLENPGGLQMGSPKYLESNITDELRGNDNAADMLSHLESNSIQHPDRPYDKGLNQNNTYEMFWSLCFSINRSDFEIIGGFDTGFEGYGGEDTDFALSARNKGITFYLTDATVYHQQHPVAKPPINHLSDIIVNSNYYKKKNGVLPMENWLKAFEDMGLVAIENETVKQIRKPTESELKSCLRTDVPFV
jgi:hypothetical protein